MHSSQITDRGREIIASLPDLYKGMDPKANPFFLEDGALHLRFDELRIEAAEDAIGGALVHYRWRGETMFTMQVEGFHPPATEILNLGGFSGKARVQVG